MKLHKIKIEKNWIYIGAILIITLIIVYSTMSKSTEIPGNVIKRPSIGDNPQKYELNVYKEGEEHQVEIEVTPREFTKEEAFNNFDLAYEMLLEAMLKDNTSLEKVNSDLYFLTEVKQFGIMVEWYSSNYEVINYDGTVTNHNFEDNENRNVVLSVKLKYLEYSASYLIDVNVIPPIRDNNQLFEFKLHKNIDELNANKQEDFQLPETIDGEKIQYKFVTENSIGTVFSFILISGIAIMLGVQLQRKQALEERNKQLQYDYSEVVSKLTLLAGAGMTIKQAWKKIVIDYQDKLKKKNGKRRVAYDEMVVAYNQMQSGISEGKVYTEFGQRCGIKEYLKLGALLEQNLRKGTRGLTQILEQESFEAFEERKSLAKKQAEEATTKLLLPMGIMLVIVMIIVIVPAFMSFSI